MPHKTSSPRNSFGISEFRGAIGDLGTTLPLAFLIIMSNGFPAARLFLLWGAAYIAVGWFYKVPISIQPLKAMAVIAVTAGFSANFLSTAAVFYGILLLLLTTTGLIQWMQKLFSQAIIRGIQLGIGLLLTRKAWELISSRVFYLNGTGQIGGWLIVLSAVVLFLLIFVRRKWHRSIALEVIGLSLLASLVAGVPLMRDFAEGSALSFTLPDWSSAWDILVLLIIPQLPLTLGNAVYAADDACHEFWPKQAVRVSPARLAGSIGILNVIIGLCGGFPVCHGAGGIAAHHRFSGKTGGTVIILGLIFVLLALSHSFGTLLFLIPVPILGVLLLFDSWQMMILIKRLATRPQVGVAVLVGVLSFITQNLSIALAVGFLLEWILKLIPVNKNLSKSEQAL